MLRSLRDPPRNCAARTPRQGEPERAEMNAPAALLSLDAALLALSLLAMLLSRRRFASAIVYGGASGDLHARAGARRWRYFLTAARRRRSYWLPIGLPWIGAHFRLDALSAFFVALVDLGAAAASLYALGYGRHEHEPERVLPFYPAFLAGMSLVPLADDAYTFLVAWEFMSLASWALVMSHHRDPENARARLRLYRHGEFRHLRAAARLRPARGRRRRLCVRRDARARRRASASPPPRLCWR